MSGKILAGALVVVAIIAGFAMYYLQVYAYYDTLEATGPEDVRLTSIDGTVHQLSHDGFEGIDSDSSPIRYRACFQTGESFETLSAEYAAYDRPEPLVAPGWFGCFDAKELGADLEAGIAMAFMGVENVIYGVDRVVAILPDGRGYAWHQINACGEVAFDGKPLPDGCPPKP